MKQCKKCGYKIEDNIWFNNRVVGYVVLITFLLFIAFCIKAMNEGTTTVQNQTAQEVTQEPMQPIKQEKIIETSNKQSNSKTLSQLEYYQAQYWEIIKRNDVLLEGVDNNDKDKNDYNKLLNTVKSRIKSNNPYLQELENIEKEYENILAIPYEMKLYAQEQDKKVDILLNEVYKDVKTRITEEEFNELKSSERRWLKDVAAYLEKINSFEYTKDYTEYNIANIECNLRKFRILLLLLYYN